jgi:transcriptional regulator with XRE-family HTH domain
MSRSKTDSAIIESFGANVRRLRVQAGWTQAKLAEIIEVELRTEQKWEAGEINVPLATLARIQEVFGCRREGLLAQLKPKRIRAG